MEGMKYVGPLVLATRDLSALGDFCSKTNILFYYWGITGEQYVAVRADAWTRIDPAKLPAAFCNLAWRDSPYAPLTQEEVVEVEELAEELAVREAETEVSNEA